MPAITVNAINAALNGINPTDASLHSAFPGVTGANEITGGAPAYARKAISFAAASGGTRTLTGGVTFDVPAGASISWIGYWSGATFLFYTPNGGASPFEFTADPVADKIICPGHGYTAGQTVSFYGGTPPGGLSEGSVYYVVNPNTNDFQVSATSGGSAIDITSYGTSDVQVCAITIDLYAAQGTHTLSTAQFGLPL